MLRHIPLSLRFFLGAEAALYAAFLFCDLTGLSDPAALKYTALLGCLLFCLVYAGGPDRPLACAALLFTALADLFLLVLDTAYPVGVACFCVVQVLYLLRLRRGTGSLPLAAARIALSGGALTILILFRLCTPLTALTALYFPQLFCNALGSLTPRHDGTPWRLFCAGLWLFVCCDICVGLHNLTGLPVVLASAVQFGMWLFYLPSQVLIVCSVWKGWFLHAA